MKRLSLLLLVGLSMGLESKVPVPYENNIKRNFCKICCKIDKLKECVCKCIPITREDFMDDTGRLSKTMVINTPGNYCFMENIEVDPEVEPTETDRAAIDIVVSGVILNFCGFVLSQKDKVVKRFIGVAVRTGSCNVSILGSYGSIIGFSQLGLKVEAGDRDLRTKDIQIGGETTLTITNCGGATEKALFFDGKPFLEGAAQIGMTEYLKLQDYPGPDKPLPVENVIIKNVIAERNSFAGIWFGNCKNVSVTKSSFSFNEETRLRGNSLFGPNFFDNRGGKRQVVSFGLISIACAETADADDTGMVNAVFEDCKFNNNSSVSQPLSGPSLDESAITAGFYANHENKGIVLRRCRSNNNRADSRTGNFSETFGCFIGGGECTTLEECEFCGNESGGNARGFFQEGLLPEPDDDSETFVPGRSLTITKCVASNNRATVDLANCSRIRELVSDGFFFKEPIGVTSIDSVAENNRASFDGRVIPSVRGLAHGMKTFGGSNYHISGFHASKNCSDTKDRECYGVIFEIGSSEQDIVIRNSTLTQNSDSAELDANGREAGVNVTEFALDLAPVTIDNCLISDHKTAGVFADGAKNLTVIDSIIIQNGERDNDVNDAGVVLKDCDCCTVMRNVLLHNHIGVFDNGDPSNNLVAQNKAFNSSKMSYEVSYTFGFPEEKGTLDSGFPTGAKICDNVGILKENNSPEVTHAKPSVDKVKREEALKKRRERLERFNHRHGRSKQKKKEA